MYISNLVLELTRKCNLRCAHCMRGPAQRMNMSREILWRIFRQIDGIGHLTLTGGEPSLGVEVIEQMIQEMFWSKPNIQYFYCISNGRTHNRYTRFLKALDRLYDWCSEKCSCCLTLSTDQFHGLEDRQLWKFYDSEWEHPYFHLEKHRKHIYNIIDEGYAHKHQMGVVPSIQQKPWIIDGQGDVMDHEVCISANGNVTSCCDMSYHRIDREHKGNILGTPLREIIDSFSEKETYGQEAA